MAHKLTEGERTEIWKAFKQWDITGEEVIRARDLCEVVQLLGQTPSTDLRMISARPDAVDELVTFEEFLIMTVGPPWEANSGHDYPQELSEAFAAIDNGNEYVPLRDLMSVLHQHMEDSGHYFTDEELVNIYRHALDVSFFDAVCGCLSAEAMWRVFEEEFADLRSGQKTETVHAVDSGLGGGSGDDGEPTCDAAHMLNLTVVDLGGKQLMVDAVVSTWSVQTLQQRLETVVGVPVRRQILCFAQDGGFGRELRPKGACLSEAGVSDGSTLLLVMKDEVKLDYKKFIARLFDGDCET